MIKPKPTGNSKKILNMQRTNKTNTRNFPSTVILHGGNRSKKLQSKNLTSLINVLLIQKTARCYNFLGFHKSINTKRGSFSPIFSAARQTSNSKKDLSFGPHFLRNRTDLEPKTLINQLFHKINNLTWIQVKQCYYNLTNAHFSKRALSKKQFKLSFPRFSSHFLSIQTDIGNWKHISTTFIQNETLRTKLTKLSERIVDREWCVPISASDPSPTPDPMNLRRFRAQGMEDAGGIFLCAVAGVASWPSPSLEPLYMAESPSPPTQSIRTNSKLRNPRNQRARIKALWSKSLVGQLPVGQ